VNTAGMLYPGDMGSAVARRLNGHGWSVVSCAEGRSARTRSAAAAAGVELLPTLEAVVIRADVAISLVPQTAVLETATAFAAASRATSRRPLYLDANSVSPATMEEVCARVAAAGVDCVDGAFIGSSKMLGSKTALYVSGARAEDARDLLAGALDVRVLGAEPGVASAFKLCMYGFNKGLVAIFLEMAAAADRLGQRDELMVCLRAFYPGSVETVERLLPTYPRHAARRAEELSEVVEWLRSIDQQGPMAAATRAVIEDLARLGLPADAQWDAEGVLEECRRRHLLADGWA
jgi:3-hydroxyisobutyrate dehydrogenase-like beta-hydroxyacid dehydrogenase